MLRRATWLLLPMVAASFMLLHHDSVFACSCAGPMPIQETFEKNAAVFSGKVTGIESDGFTKVTFQVDRAWKGVSEDVVTVRTPSQSTACGYPFEEGKSYLVYAFHTEDEHSPLGTASCGRTTQIEYGAEHFAVLGEGYVPPARHSDLVLVEPSGTGDPLPVIFGMGAAVAAVIAFLTLRRN